MTWDRDSCGGRRVSSCAGCWLTYGPRVSPFCSEPLPTCSGQTPVLEGTPVPGTEWAGSRCSLEA